MTRSGKSRSRRGRKQDHRAKLKPQDWTLGLEVVHPKAAAIDVGNREHYVAVPPHMDAASVRRFECFTENLIELANWLVRLGIETVVMQSTGVYWIALYDLLEERGIEVFLVNAHDTKNLPGRKSDVQECQWLLKLHVYGLLRKSFRPEAEIRVMRTLWRQRHQHIADAAQCIQRMQKALTQMNIQLANVISDLSGTTGQAIVRAILAGERDPHKLAELRDPRVRASRDEIAKSLRGNWRPELLFVLKQEYNTYQALQQRIQECDEELYQHYQTMERKADPKELEECLRSRRPRGHVPENFDLREAIYSVSGVDLTRIDGINVLTAQTVISEVGYDVSAFPDEGNFASWLNLCPRNRITGGRIIGQDRRKAANPLSVILRQSATALERSDSYLGAQFRRFKSRLGATKAIKAMANKLARIIYRMLKYGQEYVDKGARYYEEKYRAQQIKMITKQANKLGLQVVEIA